MLLLKGSIDIHEYRREKVEELYEIGKNYDSYPEGFDIIHDLSHEDGELIVVSHDSILAIVRDFAQKHLDYLKKMITPYEELSEIDKINKDLGHLDSAEDFVKRQINQFKEPELMVYDADLNSPNLVKSWNYQFELFEILRIYKTFDTEKYYVMYYGY